jgi:hypothetical protein
VSTESARPRVPTFNCAILVTQGQVLDQELGKAGGARTGAELWPSAQRKGADHQQIVGTRQKKMAKKRRKRIFTTLPNGSFNVAG